MNTTVTWIAALCLATTPLVAADNPAKEAFLLRLAGETEKAQTTLKDAIADEKEDPRLWFELARIEFYRAGTTQKIGKALEYITKARTLEPTNARYAYWEGKIGTYNFILLAHAKKTEEMGPQMDSAIDSLETCVKLDPRHAAARQLLVSCYGNNSAEHGGDKDKAKAHALLLDRIDPVQGLIAECSLEVKDPKKRLARWKALVESGETSRTAWIEYAKAQVRVGDEAGAVASAESALSLDANDPEPLLEVAIACGHARKFKTAVKLLERYVAEEKRLPAPLAAYGHMALGQVLRATGETERAKEAVAKAKKLDALCWFTMRPPPKELFAE